MSSCAHQARLLMEEHGRDVPYFCQWESAGLAEAIITGSFAAENDPLWRQSGALTCEEYALWSFNVCGMACLKMLLAARTGRVTPIMDLTRQIIPYGGYVVNGENIKGLIYAPFVKFVREAFGIESRIETGLVTQDIPKLMEEGDFFIASVHHYIRWPEKEPPKKGGHLILVTAADEHEITFNNPSGHCPETQKNAQLSMQDFDRYFAGRGILILKEGQGG